MTDLEKTNYVSALYQLRTGPDLINDLALYHRAFFNLDDVGDGSSLDIHMNLPDEPEKDIFLAWHRRQILELEHAIQGLFPYLSVPYIDWTSDNSTNSPVWDFDFLGQFDEDWGLNRNLGASGQLPDSDNVQELLNFSSDYYLFSNNFERGVVHAGPHNWVGGVMVGGSSPRDPIFYLHHTNVDRIWQEWEKENEASLFIRSSMLRYDGTYVFNGNVLPTVNPNNLINSNSIGVFYAENQFVNLEDYEVSNSNLENEYFYYQYQINISNNFIVPSGNTSTVESIDQILIKPGFYAESGSNFIAKIDDQILSKSNAKQFIVTRNQIPFEQFEDDFVNLYESFDKDIEKYLPVTYPNPFHEKLIIDRLKMGETYQISVFDMLGNLVYNEVLNTNLSNFLELNNLIYLNPGVYILELSQETQSIVKLKIIKN